MINLDEKTKKYAYAAAFALVALLSVTLGVKLFTASTLTTGTVTYLDSKKTTVLELTAAATTSSAAITMIPGDIGTPIADKLADLSGYTLIVLCAIFLEKYLVTIIGRVAFGWLVPVSAVLWIAGSFITRFEYLKRTAWKIIAFSLILSFSIPASVWVSRTIESNYETSIQETIDSATQSAEEIQNNAENQNLWDRFISTIEGGVNTVTQRFEGILNNFIEAVAVLIVTACVIPILVLIFMFWVIKMVFRIDVPLPRNLRLALNRSSAPDQS